MDLMSSSQLIVVVIGTMSNVSYKTIGYSLIAVLRGALFIILAYIIFIYLAMQLMYLIFAKAGDALCCLFLGVS